MIYSDQNIHISHGMTSIRLVFGEHALEMSRAQALNIAELLQDRLLAERCCATCKLWTGRGKEVMGRCSAATPVWATREKDCMHRSDGADCELYSPHG